MGSEKCFRKQQDYFLTQYPTSNAIAVHLLPSVSCIHHPIPLAIAQKRYNFYEILLVCLPGCLRTDISVRLGQKKKKKVFYSPSVKKENINIHILKELYKFWKLCLWAKRRLLMFSLSFVF